MKIIKELEEKEQLCTRLQGIFAGLEEKYGPPVSDEDLVKSREEKEDSESITIPGIGIKPIEK